MPQQRAEDLARLIGLKIGEFRKDRALTQQALAELVAASVQWISRVETGQENLTLATLVKLSNALDVEVVDLFAPPKDGKRKVGPGRPRKV